MKQKHYAAFAAGFAHGMDSGDDRPFDQQLAEAWEEDRHNFTDPEPYLDFSAIERRVQNHWPVQIPKFDAALLALGEGIDHRPRSPLDEVMRIRLAGDEPRVNGKIVDEFGDQWVKLRNYGWTTWASQMPVVVTHD